MLEIFIFIFVKDFRRKRKHQLGSACSNLAVTLSSLGAQYHWYRTRSGYPSGHPICESILQWRHNERVGVSNHQRLNYLLNCLFRRRSKKTSASLAFERGILLWSVDSPHKGPVTRGKCFHSSIIEYLHSNPYSCYQAEWHVYYKWECWRWIPNVFSWCGEFISSQVYRV